MEIKEKKGIQGKYRFIARDSKTGEIKSISPWHKNLIVASDGYGLNLICRQLSGDNAIPLEISELQIGTGNTPPVAGDTGLETPVATGILRANQSIDNAEIVLSFFVSDLELDNGTYEEIGIFCGNVGDRRLFARSIISPAYTKADATDTIVEYTISLNSV